MLGITMPITKHSYQVRNPEELPGVIKEAFHIATTGRPGPVLIDIPKDVAGIEGTFEYDQPIDLPGYQPKSRAELFANSQISRSCQQSKETSHSSRSWRSSWQSI
ncbi:hypothetical protein ACEQPO_20960 [Bacillus sp. SL00103]